MAEIRSAVYRRSLPLATRDLPIVLSELDQEAGVTGASVLAVEGVLQTTRVANEASMRRRRRSQV